MVKGRASIKHVLAHGILAPSLLAAVNQVLDNGVSFSRAGQALLGDLSGAGGLRQFDAVGRIVVGSGQIWLSNWTISTSARANIVARLP